MQGCPYDALYIYPGEHTAQKCNYCVHRVEVGIEPACVVVCPEQAIIAGDLDDPTTRIAQVVASEQVFVRAPEQGTEPNLWYKGVVQADLDPLAAESVIDNYIWRDPPDPVPPWMTVELTPKNGRESQAPPGFEYGHNGAPPRVVYNTDHPMPWGWRVSSYFLTKGIAAGLALAVAIALLAGSGTGPALINWVAPLAASVFLALTGGLLVTDLKRPDRFFYLLTKGRWGSWLVRGAVILSLYAAVLGLWFLAGVTGADDLVVALVWVAVPIALASAGYTAFLFGQAEGRDLWQNPRLLWHMVAGAFAVGGGAGLVLDLFMEVPDSATTAFQWTMIGGAAALGLIAFAELTSRHPTRNIADAMHHMTRGVYAREWWLGGQGLGVVLPIVLGVAAVGGADWAGAAGGLAAMAGIWFADDAFVKAGQSVPLS